MSPGCMLLFVFGFVGGAVVINSAVLVSLSVLLLVHYSVSTGGLPALPSLPSLPRPSRYNVYVCLNLVCRCVKSMYLILSSLLLSLWYEKLGAVQSQRCCHVGVIVKQYETTH